MGILNRRPPVNGKKKKYLPNNPCIQDLFFTSLFSDPLVELQFTSQHGWRLSCQDFSLHVRAELGIDFLEGKYAFRSRQVSSAKEAILRAVGSYKAKKPLHICDATGGLGMDSLVLAQQGCKVTCIERSPYLALLLHDAMYRYLCSSKKILQLNIVFTDAITYLSSLASAHFDVIYLDPMYPMRDQSALSQQPIRLVRNLVGDDHDADSLFALARKVACTRVVVKRPMHAISLGNEPPHHQIKQKNHRFDVYVI
jgi:16S rRNA (guanine1516-N2)-methyltransferase